MTSLSDALEMFLTALEARGDRPRTVDTYRQRVTGLIRFFEDQGKCYIEDVGPGDLDAWVVSLYRQSRRWEAHPWRAASVGGLSKSTISGRIQAAKSFFKFLVDREYLGRSPAGHLRKPNVDLDARGRVMDVSDLLAMIAVAEEDARAGRPRDLALVTFLYESGCRAGEAVSLRVENVNLDVCEAQVSGKAGERWVDFADRACDALRGWLAVRPEVDHEYVFVGRRGEPLRTRGIWCVMQRLAERAGVNGRFNPQAIRHLVGQTFTDEENLKLAQEKLGHKQISTTSEFYAHQDRSRVKAATRRRGVGRIRKKRKRNGL